MMTPYQILDVVESANDTDIKQAYLGKVKANPPDSDQQQFRLIHEAYSSIKDHKSRVSYTLFTLPDIDFDLLINKALHTEKNKPITSDLFKQLLNKSVDKSSLLNELGDEEKP
ncbi:MAG: DnaJ domain-containing protein [Methylococcales bacterium]|nr:DnaJ domain-containing protein [Methylococcales bacterium]